MFSFSIIKFIKIKKKKIHLLRFFFRENYLKKNILYSISFKMSHFFTSLFTYSTKKKLMIELAI